MYRECKKQEKKHSKSFCKGTQLAFEYPSIFLFVFARVVLEISVSQINVLGQLEKMTIATTSNKYRQPELFVFSL